MAAIFWGGGSEALPKVSWWPIQNLVGAALFFEMTLLSKVTFSKIFQTVQKYGIIKKASENHQYTNTFYAQNPKICTLKFIIVQCSNTVLFKEEYTTIYWYF